MMLLLLCERHKPTLSRQTSPFHLTHTNHHQQHTETQHNECVLIFPSFSVYSCVNNTSGSHVRVRNHVWFFYQSLLFSSFSLSPPHICCHFSITRRNHTHTPAISFNPHSAIHCYRQHCIHAITVCVVAAPLLSLSHIQSTAAAAVGENNNNSKQV